MEEAGVEVIPVEWFLTYTPKDFNTARKVDTPANMLELLKVHRLKKGTWTKKC